MNKTVLVVDDSDFVLQLVTYQLESEGYLTLSGVDGRDALKLLDGRDIDLLITDLNMPNMDGISLIRYIRSTINYQYLPIVLFTSGNENNKVHINNSGATELMAKETVSENLVPTVRKMIG